MKTLSVIFTMLSISMILFGCAPNAKERQMEEFIAAHVEKIKPMEKEANLAYWDAATSGKEADYDKVSTLTLELRRVYSDPGNFTLIKEAKESSTPTIHTPQVIQQPRPKDPQKKARFCPYCGEPLSFIEQYQRHYCYSCERYI